MYVLIIALVMALFVHDASPGDWVTHVSFGWADIALIFAPKLVISAAYAIACTVTLRRLRTPARGHALRRLDQVTLLYSILLVISYYHDLWIGSLAYVRSVVGDLVLLDEVLVLTPPILMVVWSWWAYYPIDRTIREASLIRRLDAGLPVAPTWTRTQYITSHLRHQVALILVPLLAMLGWSETIVGYAPEYWPLIGGDPRPILLFAGSVSIFLLAPLVIRHLWDTVPLPTGTLRVRLEQMCAQYKIGVRDLLLWRTFGGMINGAVMGLIAPVRYILLTDALLESMPQRQIEAVMAHEIAHVRRRHMFWLVAVAGGTLGSLTIAWILLIVACTEVLGGQITTDATIQEYQLISTGAIFSVSEQDVQLLATGASMVCWIGVLGWTSRRFERQADTFAVQHLARDERGDMISPTAIETMASALQQVADLNHISTTRRSWWHGSILSRQTYLRSLEGQPIDRTPIDRQVLRIKIVSALVVLALIALYWVDPAWVPSQAP